MNLTQVSELLNLIVSTIENTIYYRATDQQANVDLDHIDLSNKTIVLFNNLPEIGHYISKSGYTTQTIPIEIKVLQLANLDDTESSSDIIRDACLSIAYLIFDKVSKNQKLPDVFDYRVSMQGEVKIYDKTMTGVRLIFNLITDRGSYEC